MILVFNVATVCQYALFIYLIQIVANREFSVYRLKELTSILSAENN